MPYIETVDELVEEIADKIGVYGSTTTPIDPQGNHAEDCNCRLCFTIDLKERIRAAVSRELPDAVVESLKKGESDANK